LVRAAVNDTDCVYTEPTPIAHEQPAIDGYLPKLRLDYILGNDAVLQQHPDMHCRVINNTVVSHLSDHLPVLCEWPLTDSGE
jgi:endonuclease/exonuclease/phosphatase family metal-dependent hydrolase